MEKEKEKPLSPKQEQIHSILFNKEIGWQEIIYDLINTEQLNPWDIDITVLTNKYLEKIEKFNTTLWRPKVERKEGLPFGKCIFFDSEKGCTIHQVKPTECRLAMGCKDYGEDIIIWFMMNHYFNPDDPESVRQYKIYAESGGKILEGAEPEKFTHTVAEDYKDLKQERDWERILGIKDAEAKENGKRK